jgi:hypothetical protein
VKRKMAVRRHSKIIEELKKEHEDFLKGETYSTNISAPGEKSLVVRKESLQVMGVHSVG